MAAWLDHLFRDLSFGVRSLRKTPGFTATAVLSLALGIMATTAIYSVLRAVVLDPFPYRDVARLMSVRVSNPAQRGFRTSYTVDQFLEIAERNTIFEGTIASTITDVLWTGEGDPQRLRGNHGTFNTFDVMGVPPLLGRTPTVDDARPGAEPLAILGYRFWQRQFGGDPRVLGRQMHLNGVVRTVIGVMPKRFMWRGADVYLPTMFERGRAVEGVRSVHLLGRLKAGVTDAQAEADLAPIIADLKQREPIQFPDQWRVGLLPFGETFPSGIRQDIWVLFGAVSLLLLIACANVSNLLLSKVASRQREMTVRAALGAGRGRLIRQLLTESLLLALAAGILGTALAYAGLPAILALVPPGMIPDEAEISLNRAVLVFALVLSAVTSVVCGLAPALHSTKTDLVASLREASRGIGGSSRHALLRKALVVVEVALALMLLAGSSLLVRTYLAMQHVELGVDPEKVLVMRVPLPERAYPDAARRASFFRELIGRVHAIPGVQTAAVSSGLHPLGAMRTPVDAAGAAANPEPVQIRQISAGYPDALRIRLASGRLFNEADIEGRLPVALVNERFVRTRIEGRSPVGLTVRVPRLRQPPMSLPDDAFQIVGVVHDAVNDGLANPVMPELYIPYTPAALADVVIIRGDREAATMARAAAAQVYAIDPNQPVVDVQSLEAALRRFEYATPRFNLTLVTVLAGCGLVLAIVGVYGVMSTAVAQQRHEIGVRMALGATSGSIARLVLARGAGLVAVGLALGLAGAIATARSLAQQVWNVPAFDALAFAAVSAVLLVAGFQACVLPARRAARIDPLVALRDE